MIVKNFKGAAFIAALATSGFSLVSCSNIEGKAGMKVGDESPTSKYEAYFKNKKLNELTKEDEKSAMSDVLSLIEQIARDNYGFGEHYNKFNLRFFPKEAINTIIGLYQKSKVGGKTEFTKLVELLVNIFGIELVGSPEKFEQISSEYLNSYFYVANLPGVDNVSRLELLTFAKKYDMLLTFVLSGAIKENLLDNVKKQNNFLDLSKYIEETFNTIPKTNNYSIFAKNYVVTEVKRVEDLYKEYKIDFK